MGEPFGAVGGIAATISESTTGGGSTGDSGFAFGTVKRGRTGTLSVVFDFSDFEGGRDTGEGDVWEGVESISLPLWVRGVPEFPMSADP